MSKKWALSSNKQPVSNLQQLRKIQDTEIEEAIKKDKDAAPLMVKWPKNTKVFWHV